MNRLRAWTTPKNPPWKKEPWDDLLPSPGFITDYVLATRGFESPTMFSFWVAVGIISTVIKREAWFRFYPEQLYPNFYIILVAPPRLNAKSTTVNLGSFITSHFHEYLPAGLARFKEVNLIRGRATPEAIILSLKPESVKVDRPGGGGFDTINRYSQIAFSISELATFLGKQKYNVGLVETLTDLYDGNAEGGDLTIGRGFQRIENVYATLMGATTKGGLEASIPESAFGDGFMSRCIIVHKPKPSRLFPYPIPIKKNAKELLCRRAAHLAKTVKGEYTLSPEADRLYRAWYPTFKMSLADEQHEKRRAMMQRFDNHLLKLATILRIQRYKEGNIISKEDYIQAYRILKATYESAPAAIENVSQTPFMRHYNRIKSYIEGRESVTRRKLLTTMSSGGITAGEVSKIVFQLAQERPGVAIVRDGKTRSSPSSNGKEIYTWVEEDKDDN